MLDRAVTAGVISADQAQAMLTAEGVHRPLPGGGYRSLTKALGYLGSLLALSGAVMLALQYWHALPAGGRLGLRRRLNRSRTT